MSNKIRIKIFNKHIVLSEEIIQICRDYATDMKKDGTAAAHYGSKGHPEKKININCFEGKLAEFAFEKYFKETYNKPISTPDVEVRTVKERWKLRYDPDLTTKKCYYHIKSTSMRNNRDYGDPSWSFNIKDPVMRMPNKKDVIICCTTMDDNSVMLDFGVFAMDLDMKFYELPYLDGYKESKRCVYWKTLKNTILSDSKIVLEHLKEYEN